MTLDEQKANIEIGMKHQAELDEIGYWSKIKLEILKEYASAYSTILCAQKSPALHHLYIDAFAGAGVHLTKLTKNFVPGSPLNALWVQPPFREYHLIDIAAERIESLRDLIGPRADVSIYQGDCNQILLERVFPRAQYKDYRRGLCVLDPYGLQLDWKVIFTAGQMKTLDIFLNFPVADMNRNVLRRDPGTVEDPQKARLNAFWGMIRGVRSPIALTRRYSENRKNSQTKWLQRPFESGLRKLPDSREYQNLYPCEIQKELSFTISILHPRRTRLSISCSISFGNTRTVEAFDVNRVGY